MAIKVFYGVYNNMLVQFPTENLRRVFIDLNNNGIPIVIDDRCKHRGGPIHLCKKDANGINRCVWHNMAIGTLETSYDIAVIHLKYKNIIKLVAKKSIGIWPVSFLAIQENRADE